MRRSFLWFALPVVVDLDVFGLDPDDLAVLPRRHGISKRFVQAPGVARGLLQGLVNRAAVLKQFLERGLRLTHGSNPSLLSARSRVCAPASRVPCPPTPRVPARRSASHRTIATRQPAADTR